MDGIGVTTVADGPMSVEAMPDDRGEGNSQTALFRRLRDNVTTDLRHSASWRKESRDNYDMVAGRPWSRAEESAFEDQGKVPIKFNRVLSVIKAVAGHEINNRHELRFYPRGVEDTAANDVLNSASQWMSDNCDAEDEESDAFEDTTICGMGWTEHTVAYDEDPEGEYQEVRVDPLEMAWDASTKRKNLADARRIHRIRKDVDIDDARRMFPDADDIELDARWVIGESDGKDPTPVEERRKHQSGTSSGPERRKVTLVDTQWWEHETFYIVVSQGQKTEMDASKFRTFKSRAKEIGFEFDSVRMQRRIYYRAFLGAVGILRKMKSPTGQNFTYTCITGERDRNEGTWFGLVSVMKDPQKFANKWLTNTLHILNVNAKGGIMAEKSAFEDQRQAEDSWANPQDITWLEDGALSGANPLLREKPIAQFPAGFFQLMQFALGSIRETTGVNMELLGMVDRNQPGILEAQRKQSAVTILATLFNNLRRFRKSVGRIRLHFIQNNLSDGRLIRVVGPSGAKAVPLIKDKTLGRFDVVIDESSTGVNQKAETWAMLTGILPSFKEMITPEVMLLALKYSPLPESLVTELESMIKGPEGGEPDPQAQQQQQAAMQQLMLVMEKDKAEIDARRAAAAKDQAATQKLLAETGQTVAETEQLGTFTDPKVQSLLTMAADAGVIGQPEGI